MSYLAFDKSQLINLEFSLMKEILRTNRAGSYLCTSLNGCNTRKYHGLLISPIKKFGGEKHVLLSSLDPTIIQHGSEFNLGIHQYQGGHFNPTGHKYIRNLEFDQIPKATYRVGGVVLSQERILVEKEQQVLIRYTLEEANSPTILRLKPFLAFRSIHALSKANLFVQSKYIQVKNGVKLRLYDGFPYLNMQFNKSVEFIPVPDWYNNIEYLKEQHRGYESLEDLFVPGYFECKIKKGESIVFSASTAEVKPASLKPKFTRELKKKVVRDSFLGSLKNSAEQFIKYDNNSTDVIAGFPWYGSITRQSFIALPGLMQLIQEPKLWDAVLGTYTKHLKKGLFPKNIDSKDSNYENIDSSLWFFWTLQQYDKTSGESLLIWEKYGEYLKLILNSFKRGLPVNAKMQSNGLIYMFDQGRTLTWMDSSINGKPVVDRAGFAVEVNALWYNAVCFALELAKKANDVEFVKKWGIYPTRIRDAFVQTFWSKERGLLADWVDYEFADWTVRPNMVIATALDYSPLSSEQNKSILSIIKKQLLTPRGLRTLSPEHPNYKGIVNGSHEQREITLHQGAVWPWLIQFFVEGYVKIHKRGGLPFVKKLMEGFEEEMSTHCIGTIAETYSGNPPHVSKGAISQAWSVAGVVAAYNLVNNFE